MTADLLRTKAISRSGDRLYMKGSNQMKHIRIIGPIVVAAIVFSAFATSSALANPLCEEHPIIAQGSSLQKLAQLTWIAGSKCAVTYTASGSAAGLSAFGVGGLESPGSSKDAFIGTDDAPNGSFHEGQLHEMEVAALGTLENPEDVVIPVAQAAIAVIANPPENCLVTKISNADLQHAFLGLTLLWSELANKTEDPAGSGACKSKITRVVRKDGSGTTYQFKHYLFEINSKKLPCVNETWEQLQPETTQNLKWPESCAEQALSEVVPAKNTGGGGVAELVKALLGSIGYAALSDARPKYNHEEGNKYHWLTVENQSTAKFVAPGTSEAEPGLVASESNCAKTNYTNKPSLVLADADWSKVYGGHPGNGAAKNTNYPICTLTWDVALMDYPQADLTHLIGLSAHEYLSYVVNPEAGQGQSALKGHDYGQVEEAVGKYALQAAELVASAG